MGWTEMGDSDGWWAEYEWPGWWDAQWIAQYLQKKFRWQGPNWVVNDDGQFMRATIHVYYRQGQFDPLVTVLSIAREPLTEPMSARSRAIEWLRFQRAVSLPPIRRRTGEESRG